MRARPDGWQGHCVPDLKNDNPSPRLCKGNFGYHIQESFTVIMELDGNYRFIFIAVGKKRHKLDLNWTHPNEGGAYNTR